MDAKPAFCASAEIEATVVRRDDGGHDREPEPVTVLRAGAVLAEAFERLRELRNGALVEHRAAAVDNQAGVLPPDAASVSSIEPPAWLWHTAFSITFSIMRRSSVGLPVISTAARCVATISRWSAI